MTDTRVADEVIDLAESPSGTLHSDRYAKWGLVAILLVGLALRVGFWNRDFPDVYHPDEPTNVGVLFSMLQNHDANPHFFHYPSLFFYLNALPYLPGMALGGFGGLLPTVPHGLIIDKPGIGIAHANYPWIFGLGRALTTVVSLLGVAMLYRATRLSTKNTVAALVAAVLLAVSPTFVSSGVQLTPDALATVAVIGVFYACVRLDKHRTRNAYLIAGMAVGLAMSLKYNALLTGVMVAVIAFKHRSRFPVDARALYAIPAAIIAFFATTPYALFDPHTFVHDVRFEVRHYQTGHVGMEAGALHWYLSYLFRIETAVVVLALASLWFIRRRVYDNALVWSFALVYGASVSRLAVRNDRTILLIVPLLCVLAGMTLSQLLANARATGDAKQRLFAGIASLALFGGLVYGTQDAVRNVITAHTTDNRVYAQRWIASNIPQGSSVLMESYSPWLAGDKYRLSTVFSLDQENPLVVEGPNRPDYILTSDLMHGRYAAEPHRYASELAKYNKWYRELDEVASFDNGSGARIDVYRPR